MLRFAFAVALLVISAEALDCDGTCSNVEPQECLRQGKAFVYKDSRKFCCDSCANINDVTEPIGCIPEICMGGKVCHDAVSCGKTEALVPRSTCYCCNTCVKRNDL